MISLPTPKGAIVSGFLKTPRIVADEIGNAINAAKFSGRKAVIAIPSEILKVAIITLPDTQNLDNAVASKIAQMAFEHPEEMTFDYKIIGKTKEAVKTIVAITNKNHVQTNKEVVTQSKLVLLASDLEMLSIFRLTSFTYKTEKNPLLVCLFSGTYLKLALFIDRVLSSIKTTTLETPRAMLDPKLVGIETVKFLDDYRHFNLLTDIPTVYLAGLPEPSFAIEKAIWETTQLKTTSLRWNNAFCLSSTYVNFLELKNRFGAFSCALGLSLSDVHLSSKAAAPVIADSRQEGFRSDLLNFGNTED
ncbi:MAG: pilus assembly protein PilM [Caldiserica bacterium]|nr:pilus assembly protein PilM [Caldisericota bacterium]